MTNVSYFIHLFSVNLVQTFACTTFLTLLLHETKKQYKLIIRCVFFPLTNFIAAAAAACVNSPL